MVIKKQHAILLQKLLKDEENKLPYTALEEVDELVARELELMGLVRFSAPLQLTLTYVGRDLANLLRELYEIGPQPFAEKEEEVKGNIVIREVRGLNPPEAWDDDFRFLGSEIIAMLESADLAGRVGPEGVDPLMVRGLASRVYDRERKKEYVTLTKQGKIALEIYRNAEPNLEIDASLADLIRRLPLGPAESSRLVALDHEKHLLEGMRLIAYSVPKSEIFAFTALGQAVKRALTLGGFGEGVVLSRDILISLAEYLDTEKLPESAITILQSLGYLGPSGELLPAGEFAMEAFRLLKDRPQGLAVAFDLEKDEVDVLKAIKDLWEKAKSNPEERPTFENLKKEMIKRKSAEYKIMKEKYGEKFEEIIEEYRDIARNFFYATDLNAWYVENFDLRAFLHSLESFQLIRSEKDEKGKEVFTLTEFGRKVLEDEAEQVSAPAVKAITTPRKAFAAPNLEWYNLALKEGLVGTGGPSRRGNLYADLAEKVYRLPFLTKYEYMVFSVIPEKGITLSEIYELLKDEFPAWKIRFAINKLEARRLIEVLPDGNVVETEAGKLLDQALLSVPKGAGFPVTPIVVRVLQALKNVGTLYVKEQKVRILPRNVAEAKRISGLSDETFAEALQVARLFGYVGYNNLTDTGMILLEAVEKMNTPVTTRYVEEIY
uniref:DUF505 domain-containing protein n=1 Tax=candidate division WOR-3 bacterium TaxID=2052148 RepID=A0A7V3KNN8_UNCW3